MKISFLTVAACPLIAASTAWAEPDFLTAFENRYPASTLPARMQAKAGSSCNVCHRPPNRGEPGNCYRDALTARLSVGRTIEQALADVEAMDSDNDGTDNVTEILAVRTDLPGNVGFSPGLVGPTGQDPCGAAGNISNQLETPPTGPSCDAIDFNGDGLFPDTADIDDFLSVFSGGACSNDPFCGDIDFNNDGLYPDTADIDSLLNVFSGGACL